MNLLLLLITIAVSTFIVRAGAVAFELTGLAGPIARFQALSCFTGTGFTTRESESITGHAQRRKIATILIILGHAGVVTMIATFANTLRPSMPLLSGLSRFMPEFIPALLLPWVNLAIIVAGIYLVYRLFTAARIVKKVTHVVREQLVRLKFIRPTAVVETLVGGEGVGLSQVHVGKGSHVTGKTLRDLGLPGERIVVMAMDKTSGFVSNPSADTEISEGDTIACFGNLREIRDMFRM